MEKKYARLAALLAAAVLCGNGAPSMADNIFGTENNGWHTVIDSDYTEEVYGNQGHLDANGIVTGHVEMTGGIVGDDVYGGWADNAGDVKDSTVTISGGTVDRRRSVYGGYSSSNSGEVSDNTVMITSGSKVKGSVYGGYSNGGGEVSGNTVTITGCTVNDAYDSTGVYGGYSHGDATGNRVTITDSTVNGIYGGWGYTDATNNRVTITDSTVNVIYGGWGDTDATNNRVTITGGIVTKNVYGGWGKTDATDNRVTITGGSSTGDVYGGYSHWGGEASGNTVTITGGSVNYAYGGAVYGGYSNKGAATGNTVTITDSTVNSIYGGWGDTDATNNRVTITGGIVTKVVYGGYSHGGGEVSHNTVALLGSADVKAASLYGSNKAGSGNTLLIDGWSGSAKSVKNFDEVTFQNIRWKTGGTVLDITHNSQTGALKGTIIHLDSISFAGGTELQTGDFMTFIEGDDLGIQEEKVDVAETFAAGVAAVGRGEMSVGDDGNTLSYRLTEVSRNTQTDLIAENRAVAAAFVNQGADIAADSLRLLDDGYHYGTQTFGAVYGNRSQYDVNSDIKINGWSEIAGFGNIHEVKGGRLAWGVFYENGTGNYRTWNTFNNEMFRGDGSLLYNGGGAAIRLTKDSGMYYEASLRAGTLSSSMTNAVKDGNGNSYGFDSDSTYWGGHIGAGKLIQRGSGQWDIYGKYFHTDIDGDSFEMGGDRFSFDSVTSDRLRLGARYTADTDKAWSLYCGAAYEYEFSGGSRMKAGQFEAPEQSLQGSTVFGEIGTVWGRKDSPWSMDVNLRGYAGEREGFSGMVQLAYAF